MTPVFQGQRLPEDLGPHGHEKRFGCIRLPLSIEHQFWLRAGLEVSMRARSGPSFQQTQRSAGLPLLPILSLSVWRRQRCGFQPGPICRKMRLGASLTPLSLASRVDNERGENTGGREATPGTGASWWRSRYSVEPMPALMRIARGPLSDGACLRELISWTLSC